MENLQKIFTQFISNPVAFFVCVSLGAVYYLYSDLTTFISKQQEALNANVETQTKMTHILGDISQRLTEIELKIYNEGYNKNDK